MPQDWKEDRDLCIEEFLFVRTPDGVVETIVFRGESDSLIGVIAVLVAWAAFVVEMAVDSLGDSLVGLATSQI